MIEEEDDDDKTIVIDREPTIVPPPRTDDPDEGERTVVVARRRPSKTAPQAPDEDDDDRTISLGRRTKPRDPEADDDKTISLGRRAPAAAPPGIGSADDPVLRLLPTRARRPQGPGAVESYPARDTVLPPMPFVADTVERDRVRPDRGALPSVARQSRRAGIRSLVVFAGACVVSVVGLVVVVGWFLRG